MYRYIFIFLCALPVMANAQSLKDNNFTWVAEQAYNLATDTIQEQKAAFISYGLKRLEMIQRSATVVVTPSQPDEIKFKYLITSLTDHE